MFISALPEWVTPFLISRTLLFVQAPPAPLLWFVLRSLGTTCPPPSKLKYENLTRHRRANSDKYKLHSPTFTNKSSGNSVTSLTTRLCPVIVFLLGSSSLLVSCLHLKITFNQMKRESCNTLQHKGPPIHPINITKRSTTEFLCNQWEGYMRGQNSASCFHTSCINVFWQALMLRTPLLTSLSPWKAWSICGSVLTLLQRLALGCFETRILEAWRFGLVAKIGCFLG